MMYQKMSNSTDSGIAVNINRDDLQSWLDRKLSDEKWKVMSDELITLIQNGINREINDYIAEADARTIEADNLGGQDEE
jgi:hypothetical protein